MAQADSTTKTNISWLKPGQVEAMRDAAYDGRHGQRNEAVITVLSDTGLRRGELAGVDRDMFDASTGQLRIPPEIQKDYPTDRTPSPATFQLDPADDLATVRTLRSYLDTRDDNSAALFPSQKSERLTGKAINDIVKRTAAAADVRPYTYHGRGEPADVSAHTLRHSLAYRLLHVYDRYSLYDVRNRLRHATIVTTERNYDHFETI